MFASLFGVNFGREADDLLKKLDQCSAEFRSVRNSTNLRNAQSKYGSAQSKLKSVESRLNFLQSKFKSIIKNKKTPNDRLPVGKWNSFIGVTNNGRFNVKQVPTVRNMHQIIENFKSLRKNNNAVLSQKKADNKRVANEAAKKRANEAVERKRIADEAAKKRANEANAAKKVSNASELERIKANANRMATSVNKLRQGVEMTAVNSTGTSRADRIANVVNQTLGRNNQSNLGLSNLMRRAQIAQNENTNIQLRKRLAALKAR